MVVLPDVDEVRNPDVGLMVATDVLVLVQVPPIVPSDNVVVSPAHSEVIPVIGDNGLTVTSVVALQPVDNV